MGDAMVPVDLGDGFLPISISAGSEFFCGILCLFVLMNELLISSGTDTALSSDREMKC